MIELDIQCALKCLVANTESYNQYQDYYNGKHRLLFATDKFRSTFSKTFAGFADNLCPIVVDALADRLQLTGFGVDEDVNQELSDKINEGIEEIWEFNRMDKRSGETMQEALMAGDTYAVVWPSRKDPSMPAIYLNKAQMMTCKYDEEEPGVLLWAAKSWMIDDKRIRLTMYYPNRLEKYITRQPVQGASTLKPESFVEYTEDGPAVIPNPYGQVPVFHFANNAVTGYMGRSELQPVLPLQDALNKAITDMLVAMEFVALPQRWVTGLDIEQDQSTGQLKWPFRAGVDRIWAVDDPNVKFGEFAAANLDSFLKVQESFRVEVARVTRTPQHYFMLDTKNYPSGESLKTSESPFTAKARDRMISFGNTWEDLMSFALKVAGIMVDPVDLKAEWKDPAPRSEKEYAEYLIICQQLTPPMLRKLGFSEDEIEEIVGGAKSVAGAIMDAFNNGIGAGIAANSTTTPARPVPVPATPPGSTVPGAAKMPEMPKPMNKGMMNGQS